MTRFLNILIFILCLNSKSQTLNLNNTFFENNLRKAQLNGELDSSISFTLRPLHIKESDLNKGLLDLETYSTTLLSFLDGKGKLKLLPIDFINNYSSHHPYNRNNGSMIVNRGYQQLISPGIYFEIGPLSVQLKPELIYAENKDYDGFWEGHYDVIWARRYGLWNRIDMPERFGESAYNKTTFGQSSIRLNYKSFSLGISSENIWWGPSIRNGIMMSNNAQGFNHITLNTIRPLKTFIGNFEFQLVTGRLEPSGFKPPNTEKTYANTRLYVPKINQKGEIGDWRFFQGYTMTYSPKWVNGLHLGVIRWVQMYGALFDGEYTWINDDPRFKNSKIGWLPIFNNFLRKNDKVQPYEAETDQAASVFFRWMWQDSKAEIYGEFNYNDAKWNLRDLILDSDHARAVTFGILKLFDSKNNPSQFEFHWEWTQLEQTGSRLIRNAASWYQHSRVTQGFTNNGEVIGASIGPGSNSQYFSFAKLNKNQRFGLAFEIVDQDNDFYYMAWEDNGDFRRYWKDYNVHLFFEKKFKRFWGSINALYSRSLNYQWELLHDPGLNYYQNGRDVDNFQFDIKITYPIKL